MSTVPGGGGHPQPGHREEPWGRPPRAPYTRYSGYPGPLSWEGTGAGQPRYLLRGLTGIFCWVRTHIIDILMGAATGYQGPGKNPTSCGNGVPWGGWQEGPRVTGLKSCCPAQHRPRPSTLLLALPGAPPWRLYSPACGVLLGHRLNTASVGLAHGLAPDVRVKDGVSLPASQAWPVCKQAKETWCPSPSQQLCQAEWPWLLLPTQGVSRSQDGWGRTEAQGLPTGSHTSCH